MAVAKKDAYNLRKVLKEKYVSDEKITKRTKDSNDSSDFVKIESDSIDYDNFEGGFSLSSSYLFNGSKNYFVKDPGSLGPREDSLTNQDLD